MAPELMSFQHAPSFAVDVYSFGVVLHHIITGEEQDQRQALRPLRYKRLPCNGNKLKFPNRTGCSIRFLGLRVYILLGFEV
jgi:serine/threonine protein kinase